MRLLHYTFADEGLYLHSERVGTSRSSGRRSRGSPMPSATCGRSSTRASARRTRRSGSSSTRSACLSKAEYPSVALALTARPLSEKLVNATQLDRPRSHLGRSAAEYEAGFALVEKRAQTLAASIDELVARGIGGGRQGEARRLRAGPCVAMRA